MYFSCPELVLSSEIFIFCPELLIFYHLYLTDFDNYFFQIYLEIVSDAIIYDKRCIYCILITYNPF